MEVITFHLPLSYCPVELCDCMLHEREFSSKVGQPKCIIIRLLLILGLINSEGLPDRLSHGDFILYFFQPENVNSFFSSYLCVLYDYFL